MPSIPESAPEESPRPRLQAFRTGLLIAGSALLGGLAVVLWNRSSLSKLRQSAETEALPLDPSDGEDD